MAAAAARRAVVAAAAGRAGLAAAAGGRLARRARPAGLARDTLAAMRARNWLTSLAVPLVAAIAVGVAGVVVLGANNRGGTAAPSALAAGFPPARSAAADFGGGGRPVQVAAIAADGATEVAVGSANRGCALWVSADGGSTWHRGALTPTAAGGASAGQLAGVAHGPSGWLAVGGASAVTTGAAAMSPAVVGSPDGRTWTTSGSLAAFDGPGRIVTAAVAAGPGGYVIVGEASTGSRTVAAAWYAPGLTGWRRAADARPGALDGAGNRAMNAVSATSRGFVAVGAVGARPAAWVSGTGRTWTLVTLALPAGAASAAFDYVAANGGMVAAVGTEVTGAGQRRPFAAVSMDAGATWTQAQLPLPLGVSSAGRRVGHRAHRRGRRLHRDRHLRPAGGDRRRGLDAARGGGRGGRVDRGGPAGHRPGGPRHAGDHRADGDRRHADRGRIHGHVRLDAGVHADRADHLAVAGPVVTTIR